MDLASAMSVGGLTVGTKLMIPDEDQEVHRDKEMTLDHRGTAQEVTQGAQIQMGIGMMDRQPENMDETKV